MSNKNTPTLNGRMVWTEQEVQNFIDACDTSNTDETTNLTDFLSEQ